MHEGVQDRDGFRRIAAAVAVAVAALLLTGTTHATDRPRYDVPPGFTRCPHATAWNGFFKWASVRHTTCRRATGFMRAYSGHAHGRHMPRHISGFRCRIRYWRNEDDDIYASRHVCRRGDVVIRFYGMV